MVIVTRAETSLTDDTIEKLIDTTITKNNQKQKLVEDLNSKDELQEINKTMKIIKEQNDEIIGDTF